MRLKTMIAALAVTAALSGIPAPELVTSAEACPNCKAGNETDSRRPRAYMLSILFMMSMPAMIFTGFGVSFYRMTKKSREGQEDALRAVGLLNDRLPENRPSGSAGATDDSADS